MKEITMLGIASQEVKIAKDLLSGKKVSEAKDLFICEGLWAVEKLIQQKISVPHFFFCPEMIHTQEEKTQVDAMCNYADNAYSISKKACAKISDREGADGFFVIAKMPCYSLADLESRLEDNMVVIILDHGKEDL